LALLSPPHSSNRNPGLAYDASFEESAQLSVAIVILVAAIGLGWIADNAFDAQQRILGGCWPDHVQINGETKLTSLFREEQMPVMTLGPVARFFHTRTEHRILLYLMVFAAVGG
jgi:hypothetical protein